jgi:hypothetical protein
MTRLTTALIAAAAIALGGASASAQQALRPQAFFGTWSGGGVAENRDSITFPQTARDTDVTIAAAGNGFAVTWTSVIRGGGDPRAPNERRVTTSRTFVPSGTNVWRCAESGDPTAGKEACWARIRGQTLTVYQMAMMEDGGYIVQQYDRTLSGTGMDLRYTQLRGQHNVRVVAAKLVKTGN